MHKRHNFTNEKQQQAALRVDSQVQDLFPTPGEPENQDCYDKFCTFLDELICEKQQDSGDKKELGKRYMSNWWREPTRKNSSISDAAEATKASLEQLKEAYTKQIKALTEIKNKVDRVYRQKALEYQIKNLKEKNLLSYLAEQNFLPSAGLPTGLVECQLGEQKSKKNSYRPISVTRHLSRSILEFAPGTQLVCNEWVYEPEAS